MRGTRNWNATEPGDAEIKMAWDEWQFCVSQASNPGWEAKAREWREMYLSLLARRDGKSRQATARP